MSAWIVSKTHIDLMVDTLEHGPVMPAWKTWQGGQSLNASERNALGRTLWQECLRSVAARYPRDVDGERPGPINFHDIDTITYIHQPQPYRLTPAEANSLFRCYRYQSCEHGEWEGSLSNFVVENALEQLGDSMDGPWGWDAPDVQVRMTTTTV